MEFVNRQNQLRMIDIYKFNRIYYRREYRALCFEHSENVLSRKKKESSLSSIGKELLIRAPMILGLIGFGCLDLRKLREDYSRSIR